MQANIPNANATQYVNASQFEKAMQKIDYNEELQEENYDLKDALQLEDMREEVLHMLSNNKCIIMQKCIKMRKRKKIVKMNYLKKAGRAVM